MEVAYGVGPTWAGSHPSPRDHGTMDPDHAMLLPTDESVWCFIGSLPTMAVFRGGFGPVQDMIEVTINEGTVRNG